MESLNGDDNDDGGDGGVFLVIQGCMDGCAAKRLRTMNPTSNLRSKPLLLARLLDSVLAFIIATMRYTFDIV